MPWKSTPLNKDGEKDENVFFKVVYEGEACFRWILGVMIAVTE